LASTYIAVVRIDVWPAICAIDFRSTPRSANRVISVRLPLCDDASAPVWPWTTGVAPKIPPRLSGGRGGRPDERSGGSET
jgi:hypothetical protein